MPSITAVPRRMQARRIANWAGSTGRSGCRSNTSPARANTSASITSLLCLPLIAPRSRAACRAPSSDRFAARLRAATDNPSQVIDVGSATATTPGVSASRAVKVRKPAKVGWTRNRSDRTRPSRPVVRMHTSCCATIAASIPTRTSRGGSLLTYVNKHEGSPFASTKSTARSPASEHGTCSPTGRTLEHARRSLPPSSVPPKYRQEQSPAPALVGDPAPCPSRRPRRGPARAHQFPSTGTTGREAGPQAVDLFHEPERSPENRHTRGPLPGHRSDHATRHRGRPTRDTSRISPPIKRPSCARSSPRTDPSGGHALYTPPLGLRLPGRSPLRPARTRVG